MHLSEILRAELDAFRERTGKEALDIIETGTIRGETNNYYWGDGHSTITFAEYTKEHGGTVISIDDDISTAQKVLKSKRLASRVKLMRRHSAEALEDLAADAEPGGIADVVFLDSDNDAALTLREYLAARVLLRTPGLVIVDDVDMDSHEVVKGHEIVPWITAHGIPYRIIKRKGDGFYTGVMVFEA